MRKNFDTVEIKCVLADKDSITAIDFDAYGNHLFVGTKQSLKVHSGKQWTEAQVKLDTEESAEGNKCTWAFSPTAFFAVQMNNGTGSVTYFDV